MTITTVLERFPPFLVRYVARQGRRGLTHKQIAARSGLAESTVRHISFSTSWASFTIDTVTRFTKACGVNHLQLSDTLEFFRRRQHAHVKRARGSQRKMYEELWGLFLAEAAKRAASNPQT